jgi:hypothetical protein
LFSHDLDDDDEPCTVSIQLQTYHSSKRRNGKHGSKRSSSSGAISSTQKRNSAIAAEKSSSDSTVAAASSAGPEGYPIPPRQREVRENPDFLRVIVLEMNMRREGKLSEFPHGKARFVLPPRQITIVDKASELEGAVEAKVVPQRWIAVGYDD